MGTAYILTNGCSRRGVDSSKIARYAEKNGYRVVDSPEKADLIFFITCGFRENKVKQSLALIKKLEGYEGEVIVLGCTPAIAGEEVSREFKGRILPTRELDKIDSLFPEFQVPYREIPDRDEGGYTSPIESGNWRIFKTQLIPHLEFNGRLSLSHIHYAYSKLKRRVKELHSAGGGDAEKKGLIRIATGCAGKCSFCSIRTAIGPMKSKELADCLEEYRDLLDRGYRLIEFSADDPGAYGRDLGIDLKVLLEEVSKLDAGGKARWEMLGLNPRYLVEYGNYIKQKAGEGRLSVLASPIQSGNERILKLMNRPFDIQGYRDILCELKEIDKKLLLKTTIIVGFPSETRRELESTIDLVNSIPFDKVLVFPYSDSKNVLASKIQGKLSEKTISERVSKTITELEKEGKEVLLI